MDSPMTKGGSLFKVRMSSGKVSYKYNYEDIQGLHGLVELCVNLIYTSIDCGKKWEWPYKHMLNTQTQPSDLNPVPSYCGTKHHTTVPTN